MTKQTVKVAISKPTPTTTVPVNHHTTPCPTKEITLKLAKIVTNAAVVACPHCGYDAVVSLGLREYECNYCGAPFAYDFPITHEDTAQAE